MRKGLRPAKTCAHAELFTKGKLIKIDICVNVHIKLS